MQNNLRWLITKANISKVEFGKKLFPNMPDQSRNDKIAISSKVERLCKPDAKIPIRLLNPMSQILDCDFNTMFGYEPKSN